MDSYENFLAGLAPLPPSSPARPRTLVFEDPTIQRFSLGPYETIGMISVANGIINSLYGAYVTIRAEFPNETSAVVIEMAVQMSVDIFLEIDSEQPLGFREIDWLFELASNILTQRSNAWPQLLDAAATLQCQAGLASGALMQGDRSPTSASTASADLSEEENVEEPTV